ncbi:MAG: hypothetical protein IT293_07750 [Deltaproteobacteria bacterium]|nr:hypothetical protein [Deltaproteobacteria bacterium]
MRRLRAWVLRMVLGCALGAGALVGVVWWRLAEGPIPLRALDRPIGDALAALVPDVTVRVGTTALVRAGRGVALEVGDVRLLTPDGTPAISLAHVRVRPSLGALLRGRVVIARVDVDDAVLPLVRRADGTLAIGEGEGAALVLGGPAGATPSAARAAVALPRIALGRSRVSLDDRRAGGTIALSDVGLVVSPRPGGLDGSLAATVDLASAVPPIRGRVRVPLRAEVGADLADDGTPIEVRFALTADAGELAPGDDPGPPLPLADVAARGRYRPDRETLDLARLAATIGGSRIAARARVVLGASPVAGLDGAVDALTLAALARLWPADLAGEARSWIAASLREGELRRCRVRLGAPVPAMPDDAGAATPSPPPDLTAAVANAVDVACDFRGVAADYLPPLDPIRDAAGSARLTTERLAVDVHDGRVGGCRVEGGTFVMDFAVDPPSAAISADVRGPTAEVLAIVEKPPIAFTPPLGITRATVGGESRVHAELRLPIARTIGPANVTVQATAELTAARLPPLTAGVGIENGTLTVRVDGARVEIEGTTAVTGLPLVTTPVRLALAVAPGAAVGERTLAIAVDGDGVAVRGTGRMAGDVLTALAVDHVRLAGTDVAGTITRTPSGGYDVTLGGASLDLDRFLAGRPLGAGDASAIGPPLRVKLDVGRVRTVRELDLHGVRGTLTAADGRIATLDLRGGLVEPAGTVAATLTDGPGPRRLTLAADQAGRVFRALGGLQQIVGGTLVLDATTDARGPFESLAGTLVVRDFKVVRAPVLARVLGIGSLGGMAALVQGEGMPMSEARLPFRRDGTRLELHDVRAVGAVGLTADGVIDTGAGTCDLRGNVIPAYTLNSALGRMPVLGRLLVGARGDGVFGIDYRVHGRVADPVVRVNPLTSIAPTVLRSWFVDPFTRGATGAERARGR